MLTFTEESYYLTLLKSITILKKQTVVTVPTIIDSIYGIHFAQELVKGCGGKNKYTMP